MNEARLVESGVVALLDGLGTTNAWGQTKKSNPQLFVDYWSKIFLDLEGSCRSDEFQQGLMAQIGVKTPVLGLRARLFQDTVIIFSTERLQCDLRRALWRLADLIIRDMSRWLSDPVLPLAFRGVVSHGSYWFSDVMVLGDPFLEAKAWYEEPNMAGVCTTPTTTTLLDQTTAEDRAFQDQFFFSYDVPLAEGKTLRSYVLPWPLQVQEEDFLRYLDRWPIGPSAQQKLENTKTFFSRVRATKHSEDES